MNRFAAASLLAALVVPGISAQEFQVDSSTGLGVASAPGTAFSLSERLDGSYSYPFDQKGNGLELRAHAQASVPADASADIDALNATFAYQNLPLEVKSLKWTVGRFALTDPTGLVLNHPGDGTKLVFGYGPVDLTIQAAYLGLVTRATSGVSLTLADQNASSDLLASPRFVGSLEGGMDVFGNHRITLGALAQQDLTPTEKLATEWSDQPTPLLGGRLDTQYLTLKAEGPAADRLFYEVFATFGSGSTMGFVQDSTAVSGFRYQYKPILSYLASGSLTYFVPEFLSSSFGARVIAASGDTDASSITEGNVQGDSNLFVPVTKTSLGQVFNPGLANLICYQLTASAKPLPGFPLVAGLKALGFQRSVGGVVDATGVVRSDNLWLGQELDVSAAWKPFSDLAVSAGAGAFIPGSGTFAPGSPGADFQYAFTTSVNLSL